MNSRWHLCAGKCSFSIGADLQAPCRRYIYKQLYRVATRNYPLLLGLAKFKRNFPSVCLTIIDFTPTFSRHSWLFFLGSHWTPEVVPFGRLTKHHIFVLLFSSPPTVTKHNCAQFMYLLSTFIDRNSPPLVRGAYVTLRFCLCRTDVDYTSFVEPLSLAPCCSLFTELFQCLFLLNHSRFGHFSHLSLIFLHPQSSRLLFCMCYYANCFSLNHFSSRSHHTFSLRFPSPIVPINKLSSR